MYCYRCNNDAGNANQCPNCGADIRYFQKARKISNAYYNRGLEQACVRNLSGAAESLRKSLKFYKYNTDARNLLGLVYFEVGETVDAIGEWVISKNFQPEDNRADFYLSEIQQNQSRLDAVNQTIKKYNQALLYCRQDSRDLAIIQLKKVLSLNPRLVKGHQLLALLYLQEGRLDHAKKTLRNAGKIDSDNTTTLRYLKEVNRQIKEQDSGKKKPKDDDLISYQSGNETIIMPKRFRETSLGGTIIALIIGLAVGAAGVGFLAIPSVKRNATESVRAELLTANETIASYNQEISTLTEELETLQAQMAAEDDSDTVIENVKASYDNLIAAADACREDDYISAGNSLGQVDSSLLSESAMVIYEDLNSKVGEQYIEQLWTEGSNAYSCGDYERACEDLQNVVDIDMDYNDGMAVYYLAQSLRKTGDEEGAKIYYQYVVDHYPDSEQARTAKNYI